MIIAVWKKETWTILSDRSSMNVGVYTITRSGAKAIWFRA